MKIKKVDDKPMVIHTKKKAKIHTHDTKAAKIRTTFSPSVGDYPYATCRSTLRFDLRRAEVHWTSCAPLPDFHPTSRPSSLNPSDY